MRNRLQLLGTVAALSASLSLGACGRSHDDTSYNNSANGDVAPPSTAASAPYTTPGAATPTPAASVDTVQHHSKLKGALVGAVAGHFAGHHALAGAAAGALVQHERNKHP